jgi:hypothetical protein
MKLAHEPIIDKEINKEIQNILNKINYSSLDLKLWNIEEYFSIFKNWILSSQYNKIIGLENFNIVAYSCGSLESIVSFVHRHAVKKRLRFSRAEFVASKIAANHCNAKYLFLEDSKIEKNDAVIISLPFSGNGDHYPSYHDLIKNCNEIGVPVLLDVSYFGISQGIEINLNNDCITDVVFSLSKPMSVQLRLGIRFCKIDNDDLVQVNSNGKLFNRLSATIGIELMKKFSHDSLVKKYVPRYKIICEKYNLQQTPTFTLATSLDDRYKEFERNGFNRICITQELLDTDD